MTGRLTFVPHPSTPPGAVTRLWGNAGRLGLRTLWVNVMVEGRIGELVLPRFTGVERGHELWQHTCFEAFVRTRAEEGYREFNVAPSMQWAAYRFDSYRSGMRPAEDVPEPRIEMRFASDKLFMRFSLEVTEEAWRVGIAAILEERSGLKSYWALAHPPGDPDFHHPDGFALEVPAAGPGTSSRT